MTAPSSDLGSDFSDGFIVEMNKVFKEYDEMDLSAYGVRMAARTPVVHSGADEGNTQRDQDTDANADSGIDKRSTVSDSHVSSVADGKAIEEANQTTDVAITTFSASHVSSQLSLSQRTSVAAEDEDEEEEGVAYNIEEAGLLRDFAATFKVECVICYVNHREMHKTLREQPKHKLFSHCPQLPVDYSHWKTRWVHFKTRLSVILDPSIYCLSCGLRKDSLPGDHPVCDVKRCPWNGFLYVLIWWIRHGRGVWVDAVKFHKESEGPDAVLSVEMSDVAFVQWCGRNRADDYFYNGINLVIWYLSVHGYWRPEQGVDLMD